MDKTQTAQAIFYAGLPHGKDGQPLEGHTTWNQLGPKTKERYERMAAAATETHTTTLVAILAEHPLRGWTKYDDPAYPYRCAPKCHLEFKNETQWREHVAQIIAAH